MTQEEALDILKLGNNVYLTGSAGSGKTYVLNQYIKFLKEHDVSVAITASTGIAASHMNGVTIHSWAGIGIRDTLSPYDLEAMEGKRYLWERFQHTKVLIIDEVSMLHHYRLDLVDRVARFFKRNDMPFGGMQVVLCGDFFQLPPVTRGQQEESQFVYHSHAWQALDLKICYLHKSYRQSDKAFLDVLNAIRQNSITKEVRAHLDSRQFQEPASDILPTKLYTHNVDVDGINAKHLAETDGEPYSYYMTDEGRDVIVLALKSSCLAPDVLTLKKGAQVMFVKNNYEAGFVNGTLGTVIECGGHYPTIKTIQGKIIKAEPMEWIVEDEGSIKAKIKQVPLRLAWAITIHKSQGMTLDAAEIDLSKSFEKGMGYVALSRLKSLDGLKLMGINETALQVNDEVLEFDEELKEKSEKLSAALQAAGQEEVVKLQEKFLARVAVLPKDKKPKKIESHFETKVFIDEKLSLKEIAKKRELKPETIIDHIEKLLEGGVKINIEHLKEGIFSNIHLDIIHDAFKKCFKKHGDYRLSPVRTMLKNKFSYVELRLARLFMNK